ncbi:ATP-binding protein [Actinosynnema sp. CA-248983]
MLEERVQALERRIDMDLAAGRFDGLVAELQSLTARHPLRERFWGQLMTARYRSQRQSEALATYRAVRELLNDELGVEPGPRLRELHEAILAGDSALLADHHPRYAPSVPRQLPVPPPVFVGRAAELTRLDQLIESHERVPVVLSAISGTAGVGKTTLAVQWANRVAERFPDGQLYIDLQGFAPAGPPVEAAEALRRFLDVLGVPPERVLADLGGRTALYRNLLADRSVLVVLDNARDSDHVRPLLPGSPGCLTLVTSRDGLTGLVVGEGAHPLHIDLLTHDDAVALVTARMGRARSAAEPDAVEELAGRSAGLPLALAVVGARIAAMPAAPLRAFVEELRTDARLDVLDTGDSRTTVSDTFSWSYRYLRAAAARVFRMFGLLPAPNVSLAAAASLSALPIGETRRALAELAQAQLVVELVPGRFGMHDLLRAYARDRAAEEEAPARMREAELRLLDHLLHTAERAERALYPEREPVSLPPLAPGATPEVFDSQAAAREWFRTEFRVLVAAARHAADEGFDRHAWQITQCMATFCHADGHWGEWLDLCDRGLAAAERLDDPVGRAEMHRGRGRAHVLLSHFDEAERDLVEAMRLFREVGDLARVGYSMVNLGAVPYYSGRPAESRTHDLQALALFKQLGHAAGEARVLTALAATYLGLGEAEDALRCSEVALQLYERLSDVAGQAGVTAGHSFALRHLGRASEAVPYLRRAVELFDSSGDRLYSAESLRSLGATYSQLGDTEKARDALERSLRAYEELRRPEADLVRVELRDIR